MAVTGSGMYMRYRFICFDLFLFLCYTLLMLPTFLHKYFWDTDASKLDAKKMSRILSSGFWSMGIRMRRSG